MLNVAVIAHHAIKFFILFFCAFLCRHYDILYPGQCEYKYARKLRCSPINSEQEARGAVFGTRMGFERPLYFDITHKSKL